MTKTDNDIYFYFHINYKYYYLKFISNLFFIFSILKKKTKIPHEEEHHFWIWYNLDIHFLRKMHPSGKNIPLHSFAKIVPTFRVKLSQCVQSFSFSLCIHFPQFWIPGLFSSWGGFFSSDHDEDRWLFRNFSDSCPQKSIPLRFLSD